MSDTKSYDNWNKDKKIKKSEKGKRTVDKYRKIVHNMTLDDLEDDDAFDEYLEHEVRQNNIKIR